MVIEVEVFDKSKLVCFNPEGEPGQEKEKDPLDEASTLPRTPEEKQREKEELEKRMDEGTTLPRPEKAAV